MNAGDGCAKNVLEARELSHSLVSWGSNNLMRTTFRNDSAGIQHQNPVSQGKDFFPIVRNVNNRNIVLTVPGPEVLHDFRFGGSIEGG